MIVYPNAKINLGLNVLEKRADGYHEISSVFYPVKELFDSLEIIPADVLLFSSSGIAITGEGNICIKAYELLRANPTFRCTRYSPNYPAFTGRNLTPGSFIELNPLPSNCQMLSAIDEYQITNQNRSLLYTTDVLGRRVKTKYNTPLFYIYDDGTVEKKFIVE